MPLGEGGLCRAPRHPWGSPAAPAVLLQPRGRGESRPRAQLPGLLPRSPGLCSPGRPSGRMRAGRAPHLTPSSESARRGGQVIVPSVPTEPAPQDDPHREPLSRALLTAHTSAHSMATGKDAPFASPSALPPPVGTPGGTPGQERGPQTVSPLCLSHILALDSQQEAVCSLSVPPPPNPGRAPPHQGHLVCG